MGQIDIDTVSEENKIKMKIEALFDKPKVIGIVADANWGKSNLIYHLITNLRKTHEFCLYSYGLRMSVGEQKIFSVEELERIQNGVVFLDEFATLLDLDNRKQKEQVERTFRLIFHNNNILVLSGLPENYKKFISAKLSVYIFGRCTIADFINGSRVKAVATNYTGQELGSTILNIPQTEFMVYDGNHYTPSQVSPYLEEFDTKKQNQPILTLKEEINENNNK